MDSLIGWIRLGLVAWLVALLLVLVGELRPVRRLMPGPLRDLARLLVLVGTVGLLTVTVLFSGRILLNSLQARADTGSTPQFELSFDSADSFLLSLYLQYIKGLTPQAAGTVLIAQPIMMALFSPLAGRLSDSLEARLVASAM